MIQIDHDGFVFDLVNARGDRFALGTFRRAAFPPFAPRAEACLWEFLERLGSRGNRFRHSRTSLGRSWRLDNESRNSKIKNGISIQLNVFNGGAGGYEQTHERYRNCLQRENSTSRSRRDRLRIMWGLYSVSSQEPQFGCARAGLRQHRERLVPRHLSVAQWPLGLQGRRCR
jgi:hypothetical protein